jgi:integrase
MANNKLNFTKALLDKLPAPAVGKRNYYYDIKTHGLGIAITSNGTKSFIVYRWVNGKPERVTLGRYPDLSIEQARRKAAEVNASIAKGENPNDKRRADRAELTLEALFEEYLDHYAKLHKKSWKTDEEQYERYLANWKKRKLSTITRIDVQKLHQELGRINGHYAANRLLALLSTLFNKATEFGLWDKTNPAKGIKKFREQSRDRFLQSDELPRFFQALSEESNDTIRDYILLSLLTGARRTNVLAMRWDEIDFARAEWRIPDTKNHTPQIVPLIPEAVATLKTRAEHREKGAEYVFPSDSKVGHMIEPKRGWQRILQSAKLQNLRLHDLRRTLGSWQARNGASLAIIGKSLNHKSPAATAIYARLDIDPVRASIEKATNAMLIAGKIKAVEAEPATPPGNK